MDLYQAQPRQQLFHTANAEEVLYGGAVGGGKSYAILWDAVMFCMQNDGVYTAVFRRTFPELEKSLILEALKVIPTSWYEYNKKEHRMYFKNHSILEYNYCQYESDVYNFQSAQYDRLYFDELTHFTKFIYLYLSSRCRTTKPNIKPQIKSASNPGNIGHNWVKMRFIDGGIPNEIQTKTDPETGHKFNVQFIPAKLQDNKYLMEGDPEYLNRLMNLPPEDRKALLEGDWNILKGQFFSEWRNEVHICEPFEIPFDWHRIIGLDWGWTNPTCVEWITFSPQGLAFVYRELMVTETTDDLLAIKIKELTGKEKIDYRMADPSLWSINQYERGESLAMRMSSYGVALIKGDNNRKSGWSMIHNYLRIDEDTKEPKLKVFNTCHYLIETLPGLIHDDHNPEDVDTRGEDHAGDALRYALMTKPIMYRPKSVKAPQYSFEYWFKKSQEEHNKGMYVGRI